MKPILFNTEMVKAILDGTKKQTRRPIKLNIKKDNKIHSLNGAVFTIDNKLYFEHNLIENFSKYKVDDVLYVRETFQTCECDICEVCNVLDGIVYKADYNIKGEHPDLYTCLEDEMYWKPSIFMPKKYARIFLKVTNVGVERLQDILVGDIIAEGYYNPDCTNHSRPHYFAEMAKKWWIELWNSTAKDGYKWEDNPYVFVYEFERVDNGTK